MAFELAVKPLALRLIYYAVAIDFLSLAFVEVIFNFFRAACVVMTKQTKELNSSQLALFC